jgi:hypothetical protein
MSSPKSSVPKGFELELLTAIQGVPSVFPQGQPIVIEGQSYTVAQFVQFLQGLVTPYTGARVTRVQLHQLVQERNQGEVVVRSVLAGLKALAGQTFGSGSAQMSALGFVPKKKAKKLTTDEMALKVARLRQTRATLHTAGSKQKEALKAPSPDVATGEGGKLQIVTPAPGPQAPGVKPV